MSKYLAINPWSKNSTYLFFYNSETKKHFFKNFNSDDWKEHFQFIKEVCEIQQVNHLIYQTTMMAGFKPTSLEKFRLFGSLDILPLILANLTCDKILKRSVNSNHKKLRDNSLKIDTISFENPREGDWYGWYFNDEKISPEELDAFLVFYLYTKKLNLNYF